MLKEKNERIFDNAPSNLSEADCIAVREQMQRMLIHPLFRSGRRCPALFQYVVEQALEKNTALLKERIIGIEVFGRAPDYDTNADSVVRTAAAEFANASRSIIRNSVTKPKCALSSTAAPICRTSA